MGPPVTLAWHAIHLALTNRPWQYTAPIAVQHYAILLWLAKSKQWGTFGYVNDGDYIAMPLSGTPLQVVVNDMADNTNPLCLSTLDYVEGKFKVRGSRIDSTTSQLWGHWIAVCK